MCTGDNEEMGSTLENNYHFGGEKPKIIRDSSNVPIEVRVSIPFGVFEVPGSPSELYIDMYGLGGRINFPRSCTDEELIQLIQKRIQGL
jgi:hypothetical protein